MEMTEEQLKNMSPEEMAELQKKNCIFCQLISGKIPSKKVYEDDKCIAILDINPANPGHILLLPKTHAMVMPQLSEDEINHLGIISKKLSHSCLRALKAEGTTIFIANGAVAGQRAPHFMVHIIPRKENDNAGIIISEKAMKDEEQRQLQAHLIGKVNEVFGIKRMPDDRSEIEKKAEEPKSAGKSKPEESSKEDEAGEKKSQSKEKTKKAELKKDKGGSGIDLDKIASLFVR